MRHLNKQIKQNYQKKKRTPLTDVRRIKYLGCPVLRS